MAEDGVAEDGAAEAHRPAQTATHAPLVPIPEPIAVAAGPVVLATSAKAEILSVAASTVGHLLVGLLIVGSLTFAHSAPDAIPVKLIPAEQAPPKPQEKPSPEQAQRQAAPPEETAPPSDPAQAAAADSVKPAEGMEAPAPGQQGAAANEEGTPWRDIAASLGVAEYGRKTTLPESLLAELADKVKRCWTLPDGWSDTQQVSVTLRFQLHPDGALDGDPAIVEFPATPIGATAAKAAIAAVKQCGPFALPADKYDQWKDIQLNLVP
jgi:colicin import membrane protein